jgi:uncharacterized RDD family membrane protein YckC
MAEIALPRYAGFWVRFWAMAIDTALLLAVVLPLLVWVYGLDYFLESSARMPRPVEFLISYIMPIVAMIIFWRYRAATPGKMLLGLRIVDARSGGKMSLGQCCLRCVAYLASTLPACLGFLWIAWDARKQAWHDKLAGTVVVRGGNAAVRRTNRFLASTNLRLASVSEK